MIQRVGYLFICLLTFVADTGNFKPDQNMKDWRQNLLKLFE